MSSRAVASPHHLSASAGRQILEGGGNAVDAAIAMVAAQGVVAPETCGLGGDLFALIHAPGWDRPRALNSSGRAGSAANARALAAEGLTDIPRDHPAAVTIPGCVDGLATLAEELGRLGLANALAPAIELASEGFVVSNEQAWAFGFLADLYRDNPAVADFYPEGNPVQAGDRVRRPDLAKTLTGIASGGRDAFYLGRPGEDIVAAVDGWIQSDDLQTDQASWVDPIGVAVRGLTGWTTPPNSQGYLGPAAVALMDLLGAPTDTDDPDWWHLLIEGYRSLAWERDDLVADPDHAPVAAERLVDMDRLERAAASVDRASAGMWPQVGPTESTAYMCVADAEGLAVSVSQSNYNGTGSTRGAARSGFLLQDRGRGFTLEPGHPNELAPGKRPLHTLSPTLWTEGSNARWVIGTRGGAIQPQLVAQVAARLILSGQSPGEVQAAPRWKVSSFGRGESSRPDFEPGLPVRVRSELERRGHQCTVEESLQRGWGPVSIIGLEGPDRNSAPDPRVDTTSAIVF